MESYVRQMEEGTANRRAVWQEILSFFTEMSSKHSKTKYEKKLQSGFRACGICPLDHNEPLSKLPSHNSYVSKSNSSLNETLIDLLKKNHRCDRET